MEMSRVLTILIFILSTFVGSAVFSADMTTPNIGLSEIREQSEKPLLNGIGLDKLGFSYDGLDIQEDSEKIYQSRDSAQAGFEFNLIRESLYESFNLRSDQPQSFNPLNYGSESPQNQEKLSATRSPASNKSNIKLFFGTLPFVSFPLPGSEEERRDASFISPDSIFVFWYFKKSF